MHIACISPSIERLPNWGKKLHLANGVALWYNFNPYTMHRENQTSLYKYKIHAVLSHLYTNSIHIWWKMVYTITVIISNMRWYSVVILFRIAIIMWTNLNDYNVAIAHIHIQTIDFSRSYSVNFHSPICIFVIDLEWYVNALSFSCCYHIVSNFFFFFLRISARLFSSVFPLISFHFVIFFLFGSDDSFVCFRFSMILRQSSYYILYCILFALRIFSIVDVWWNNFSLYVSIVSSKRRRTYMRPLDFPFCFFFTFFTHEVHIFSVCCNFSLMHS